MIFVYLVRNACVFVVFLSYLLRVCICTFHVYVFLLVCIFL